MAAVLKIKENKLCLKPRTTGKLYWVKLINFYVIGLHCELDLKMKGVSTKETVLQSNTEKGAVTEEEFR